MATPDWPYITAEIAFPSNPNSAGLRFWNVTPWLLDYSTARGRADEQSKSDAASSSITLDDSGRHFDPFNTSSVFYPWLIPMRYTLVRGVYPTNILRPLDNASFQLGNTNGWSIWWTGGLIYSVPNPIQVVSGALQVQRPADPTATQMYVIPDFIPVSSPRYEAGGEILTMAVDLANPGLQTGTQTRIYWQAYDAKKGLIGGVRGFSDWYTDGVPTIPVNNGTTPFDLPASATFHRYGGTIITPPNCAYVRPVVIPWGSTTAARNIKIDNVSVRPGSANLTYVTPDGGWNRMVGLVAPGGWPQEWGFRRAEVNVDVADFYQLVNNKKVFKYFAPAAAGARIARLLDEAGLPSGTLLRSLSAGDAFGGLQAETLDGEEVGAHIQEAADSDLGIFYFNRNGAAVFDSRSRRRTRVSVATFSDNPGAGEATALTVTPNSGPLMNDISVVPVTAETPKIPADAASVLASQRKYLRYPGERTPLTAYGVEAQAQADYLLWRYKDSDNRFLEIEVDPTRKNRVGVAGWTYAHPRDVGNVITVRKDNPPGHADVWSPIQLDCIIEGLEETVSVRDGAKSFRQVYRLSPVIPQPWAKLGTVGSSELNTTFVLGL